MDTSSKFEHYLDKEKRLYLAKAFVRGSIKNMERVLSRYISTPVSMKFLRNLKRLKKFLKLWVMGYEALARQIYYSHFDSIIKNF